MQRATTRLAANVGPALAGSSSAAYRLTPAFNALSNCRNPLDIGLAQTPPELTRARRQTIHACRLIYVGTDRVISGLNTLSSTTADAGIARVQQRRRHAPPDRERREAGGAAAVAGRRGTRHFGVCPVLPMNSRDA